MSLINGDESPLAMVSLSEPAALCEQLLTEVEAAQGDPARTAPGNATRTGTVTFLGADHWTADLLLQVAGETNRATGWNLALVRTESPQVASYGPGEEFGWHVDAWSHGDLVRKLTVSVQLDPADAYDGGDLQLSRFGSPEPEPIDLPPTLRERGSVLVFPSYQLHRVTPVTRGLRRSLVGWILGPRYV